MTCNRYFISKKGMNKEIIFIDYEKLSGFDVTPKNRITYDGISVNKLIIIKPSFIEKLLKKKIKRKLETYLKFIMEFIDGDNDDGGTLNEILNDVKRYKDILNYRYRKFLGDGYIDLLLKQIGTLEYELKAKLYTLQTPEFEKEQVEAKSR